ncbi:MAG TPA: DUF5362 family protein [Puia sp.]|nr:DUF5362 family protein [Puia sp.]
MEPNTESNLFELAVDNISSSYLKETAKWAKFLSIIGFITCGFLVLIALFAGSLFSNLGQASGFGMLGAGFGAVFTVIYLIIAALYFFPCLYLFNFAAKMQVALRSNDQDQLTQSFKNLKSCYRFVGILTVIWLCLCILFFILGVIGNSFR